MREEFSFCLGCRACEPVCPAGVRYGTLLEHGRDAVGPARDPKLRGLLMAVGSPRRTRLVGADDAHRPAARAAPDRSLACAARSRPGSAHGRLAGRLAGAPDGRRRGRRAGRAVPRLRRPSHVLGRRARGLRHARDGGLPRHDAARAGLLRRAARAQRRSRRRAQAGRLDGALVRRQRRARSSRRPAAAGRSWPTTARCSARPRRPPSARACATTRRCSPGATFRCSTARPAARRLPGLVPPAQRAEGDARAARAARVAAGRRGRRPPAAPAAAAVPPAPTR